MEKPNREDKQRIVGHGETLWSDWFLMMAPKKRQNFVQRRFPHEGSRKINLANIPESCGIYEWKVRRYGIEKVVYIGSTCSVERNSNLNTRITRYCNDGSHKCCLINPALKRGYELLVRFKKYRSVIRSTVAENFYLGKYNYAWNIRKNDGIRNLHL
jgi:hypothetical protein